MRIGLTYTGSDEKHDNYVRWIQSGDTGIEVVRLSAGNDNLEAITGCDGLVLSGGVDIDPSFYGGSSNYVKAPVPAKGWQPERDAFEKAVLERAWELEMPVLGVCRGLQLINVCLGGTLVQDLGEAGDEMHEAVGRVDKRHAVSLEEGSLLYAIAGIGEGEANSAHHQSIDKLGKGLAVNSHAADGTIEGIEYLEPEGRPFMIAVQWHPERMYRDGFPDKGLYGKLRDRFISCTKKLTGTI